MLDVLTLGDLMIDFTPAGLSPKGNILYERNPGGAPANVAVTVCRLGGQAGFVGTVSNDDFGRFLADAVHGYGVDIRGLRYTDQAHVKMAFVTLDENNNRSFYFTSGPIAETYFSTGDIDEALLDDCRILLLSTVSQYTDPMKTASAKLVELARQKGKLLTYDPNWNIAFSSNHAMERDIMLSTLLKADIVKISAEEAAFLFGGASYAEVAQKIQAMGAQFVTITLGSAGCYYCYAGGEGHLPTYDTRVRDTTGSGDAFIGGLLYQFTRVPNVHLASIPRAEMEGMIRFAHACGAVCATHTGAMPSVEDKAEVECCMREVPILKTGKG